MKSRFVVIALTGLLLACASSKQPSASNSNNQLIDGKFFAAVFQQRAAEYKALCFQAYNAARLEIDNLPHGSGKPRAIVTDIDETVLDNSPSAIHQALLGKDYEPKAWAEWTALAAADTVPGACSFFRYAASKGIEVFYISNRAATEIAATIKNLQAYKFPFADEAHMLFRQGTSSKEARRKLVAERYDIVMLCGDNLSDFSDLFDKKTEADRSRNTIAIAPEFGRRFIVLPNPVYGDWEAALYQYNYGLSNAQKDSVLKANAKSY